MPFQNFLIKTSFYVENNESTNHYFLLHIGLSPLKLIPIISQCSVSCGEGTQVRMVECRDSADKPSSLCPLKLKPNDSKPCSTGIQCPHHLDTSEEFLPGLYHTQPLVQPYPPPPPAHAERLVGEQVVPSEST